MRPSTITFLLVAFLALAACDKSPVDKAENDEVFHVSDDDPYMRTAFQKAHEGLDAYLAEWRHPAEGNADFAVKVGVTEGADTEYFWISPFREDAGTYYGVINNEPSLVSIVKLGQEISFTKEQIVDWLYISNGKMVGNYTACAMLMRESESDRRAFEERFGLSCASDEPK